MPVDEVFDVLSDAERRKLIAHLADQGPCTLDEMLDELAEEPPEPDRRRRRTASLTHVHLPKLADAGFVEYDGSEGRIAPTDRLPVLEPFLAVAGRSE